MENKHKNQDEFYDEEENNDNDSPIEEEKIRKFLIWFIFIKKFLHQT